MESCVANHSIDISRSLGIGGWMSEKELIWLATQALTRKYIVEFGCLHGRSSRALADNMPQNGKLFCVDPWAGDYYDDRDGKVSINTRVYPYFLQNMQDHIQEGRVIPVRKYSYQFSSPVMMEMVFIDGDHRKETVRKDIINGLNMLKENGLLCGHDYGHPSWPGVKEVVDEMFGKNIQIEGTIWSTIKY